MEFVRNVTVRTATDTMRNQGIITLLLTVKGSFEPKLIKERLQVTSPAQDTCSTVDKTREVVELHRQEGRILASVCDTELFGGSAVRCAVTLPARLHVLSALSCQHHNRAVVLGDNEKRNPIQHLGGDALDLCSRDA